jgi:nucleoid-associated protein YgaU
MRSRSILRLVFGVALHLFAADYARGQSLDWVKQGGGTISTGGQSVDAAEAIAVDSQGNSYITGTFRIEATFGAGKPNQTVIRVSATNLDRTGSYRLTLGCSASFSQLKTVITYA